MLAEIQPTVITRSNLVDTMAVIRREWQEATQNGNLLDVSGSIGFLLVDLVDSLDFTREEKVKALGGFLYKWVESFLDNSGDYHTA